MTAALLLALAIWVDVPTLDVLLNNLVLSNLEIAAPLLANVIPALLLRNFLVLAMDLPTLLVLELNSKQLNLAAVLTSVLAILVTVHKFFVNLGMF
jgi:hypothetical protein